MDTKHGKMMAYYDGFPSITLYNPLNTWSREATDKLKTLYFNYHNAYIYQAASLDGAHLVVVRGLIH